MTKTNLTNDKDQPGAAVDEGGEREEDCGEGLSHRPHPGKQSTTVVKAHKLDVFLGANQTIHRLFNLTRSKEDLSLLLYLCQERSFCDHVQNSERYSGS